MGHDVSDKLTDYRATVDQLYTPFYGTMMKRDRYLHILRYLHFTEYRNEPDRTDENFDRPWKIRYLSEILNVTFYKFKPFRKSGYWRSYCFLQGKGDFQTIHTNKTQAFRHQNFQTLLLDWIHMKKNTFWSLPHKDTVLTTSRATFLREPAESSQYVSKRTDIFAYSVHYFCIFTN